MDRKKGPHVGMSIRVLQTIIWCSAFMRYALFAHGKTGTALWGVVPIFDFRGEQQPNVPQNCIAIDSAPHRRG